MINLPLINVALQSVSIADDKGATVLSFFLPDFHAGHGI